MASFSERQLAALPTRRPDSLLSAQELLDRFWCKLPAGNAPQFSPLHCEVGTPTQTRRCWLSSREFVEAKTVRPGRGHKLLIIEISAKLGAAGGRPEFHQDGGAGPRVDRS